jgi:aminoglycoside phosphotransferase (APT) family kinase protein
MAKNGATLHIEKILADSGHWPVTAYRRVWGGEDSSVWQIETANGARYAVRLLPRQRHRQFLREQAIMAFAREQGLPVPKIHSVQICKEWAVMSMEWAPGRPIVEALMAEPEAAHPLGVAFGSVQAAIHTLKVPAFMEFETENWLTPATDEEKRLMQNIASVNGGARGVLLHLDYHPLNVLTDGHTITAVLDWANAAQGDPRFDIARTLSILQLEGRRPGSILANHQEALSAFERGWLEGYEQEAGKLGALSIFKAWAGLRMIRDFSGRRQEEDVLRMRRWAKDWLRDASSQD